MPQGITKGMKLGGSIPFGDMPIEDRRKHRTQDLMLMAGHGSKARQEWTSKVATIPPELSACVAEYAERLLEQKATVAQETNQQDCRWWVAGPDQLSPRSNGL